MTSGLFKINRLLWLLLALFGGLLALQVFTDARVGAATGINKEINFQGRLLNAQGATVPDGFYNLEFKIYQDGDGQTAGDTTGSPTGSLKWTEDYLNSASHGVKVVNGYLSVELGSINPFGSSVDWNQDTLWLSMQVGNTSSCTISTDFHTDCAGDGEMVPMQPLTAAPYALNAGALNGLTGGQFVQLAQGLQTDASTGTNSIYINKTGTGNLVDLQSGGTDSFVLTNAGNVNFGVNANHTISIATAGSGVAGKTLTISSGAAGTGGSALAGGDLTIDAGVGGGTNGNGGNVVIDAGAPNGTGAAGTISVGTNNAKQVTIGNTSETAATTITGSAANGIALNGNTSVSGSNTFATGTGNVSLNGDTTLASGKNFTQSGGGTFTTGTGTVLLQGQTNVAASASLAVKAGTTYTTPGTANSAPLNTASFYLLNTSGAAQIINGITAGRDGQLLTLTNAHATLPFTLSNLSGSASAANQISTGTGSDLSIPVGSSVEIIYDATSSLWRVIGYSSSTGSFIQNQNISSQPANFRINGTGEADTSLLTPLLDALSGGSLAIGGGNATGVTIGNTTNTASVLLQGTNAATYTIGTAAGTGTITIGNSTSASGQHIYIGHATATGTQTIGIGDSASGSGNDLITIGNTNGASQVNINAGSGGIVFGGSTSVSGSNTFATGTGNVSLNGDTTLASGKNFSQSGAGTFSTGTGAVGLNGQTTLNRNGTGAADYTLGVTGTTSASATSSLVRIGNAITGGNSAANGGTYLGINESSSGAGSAADFLNLQNGTTVEMQLTSAGNLTVNGTYNTNTLNGNTLTFGSNSAASITSSAAGSNNLSLDTGASGGTLNLGNTAATSNLGTSNAAHTIGIGTGGAGTTTQAVTIGAATNSSSTLTLQGGNGASAIALATGNNGTTAGGIQIGNTSGAFAQTIGIGTNNAAANIIQIGTGTSQDNVTIGDSTTASSIITLKAGSTGGINLSGNTTVTGSNTLNVGTGTSTFAGGNISQTGSGTFSTGTGNVSLNGDTAIASGKNFTQNGGGTFNTGTGAVGLNGNTTVGANLTVTNAGTVAFQKATSDITATGNLNNQAVAGSLVRFNGASAQTLTGISGGVDGRILTLVNIAATPLIINNNDTVNSSGSNVIITGTGGALSLGTNSSITLFYDAGSNVWRVSGSTSVTGGYIQNQNAIVQPADFRINGTGEADTSFLTPSLDALSGGTLAIGGTNATSVTIGSTTNTASVALQGTVGATYAIGTGTGTGNITLGQSTAGENIYIGHAQVAAGNTQNISIGDQATGTGKDVITIGNTNGSSTVNINAGSGSTGITLGGNTTISGSNTFSTGTGAVGLNGQTTLNRNGTGAADYTLGVTGTTSASATSSLVRIGNAITGGNSAANGGTYLGINESSSGAGSAADFLNLQNGTTVEMQLTSAGNLTVNGTYNTNTLNGNTLTFGSNSAASITSSAAGSNNLSLDTGASGGTLNLGNTAATSNLGTSNAAHTIGIGTGGAGTTTQAVTIGAATNSSSTLTLQGGNGASAIALATGNNGTTAGGIQIGNTSGAFAQTIGIGTNNAATNTIQIGTGTSQDAVTIGNSTTSTSAVTINAGSAGGIALNGNTTISTNSNFTLGSGAGSGNFDAHNSSGSFQTSSGANSLNGATTVTGTNSFTVNAGATTLNGLAAGSSTALKVTTNAASNVGLTVQGAASQTANLLQLQDNNGVGLYVVDAAGDHEISSGYLNTAYGGLGVYGNLLTYSEQFDHGAGSPWSYTNVTTPSANTIVGPDTTTTAEALVDTSSGGSVSQVSGTAIGSTYTFSVWIKATSSQAFSIRIDGSGSGTGTAVSGTANTNWQRFSVTQNTASFTGNVKVVILPGAAGTGTVHAWGAQLVQASSAGVYVRAVGSTVPAGVGLVDNGNAIFKPSADSTAALQIQNAAGASYITADASNTQLILGSGSTTGKLAFSTAGGGTLTINPTSSASSFTITLPAETGTVCTTAATSTCSVAGTGYVQLAPTSAQADATNNASININKGASASGNLLELQKNSVDQFKVDNTGSFTGIGQGTLSRNGTGAADYTLGVTGTTSASATSSLVRIGNAITGGNSAANGGTYLGINESSSGAGSAADFLNLQNGTTVEMQLTSAGNLTVNGTYNTNTLNGNTLTFGSNSAASITSSAAGSNNLSLDTGASGGTLNLGNTAATSNLGTSNAAHTIGIGTGGAGTTTQAVTIGAATNSSSTLTLQGGNGASAIALATGNNGTTAGGIQIGNTSGAFAQTIGIGTNNAATNTIQIGTGTSQDAVTIGNSTTSTSAVTINAGSAGGIALNGNTTISTNSNFTLGSGAGSGNFDAHNSSGSFQTSSGANSLNGATTVTGTNSFTVNAGATTLNGLAAGSSTALKVTTNAASNVGLTVQGAASQTANLLQLQDNNGVGLYVVDAAGDHEISSGYLNTAYGGLGTYSNLLTQSEAFNNGAGAPWTYTNVTTPSLNNAGTNAPDGNATAESLADSSSGGKVTQSVSGGNNTYTFSVWIRATSSQAFALRIDSNGTPATGNVFTATANTNWQRYSVTQQFTSGVTSVIPSIFPGGTGASGTIQAWGAQLVQSNTAGVYIRTVGSTVAAADGLINNGNSIFKTSADSTTAYQFQNATGINVATIDTTNGQLVLGSGSGSLTGQVKFNYTGQTGSITLAPANPTSSAISLTLPADTTVGATICTNTSLSACNTAGALTNVAYLNATTQTFTGINSFSRNGTGAADYTLGVTGTTSASATSSLVRIGNAITGGNSAANGGTYLGINESSSGAGSAADFLNLQNGTTVEMQLTSAGNLTVNGTYNTNTLNGNTLTFGSNSAASITSSAAGSNNLSLDTGASGGTLNLGNTAATSNLGTSNAAHTIGIGTGGAGTTTQAVTIGAATNSSSTLTLQGGNGASAIALATGNNGTTAGGIQIGNTSGAFAQTIGIGTNNAATNTIQIGTGTSQDAVTIGNSTASTSTVSINAGTGPTAIQLTQGSGGTIVIGNTAGASAVTTQCGTGACAFGSNATDHTTSLGSSTGVSQTSINAGTTGLTLTSGSSTIVKSTGGSANAFSVQNASNAAILNADTNGAQVTLSTAATTYDDEFNTGSGTPAAKWTFVDGAGGSSADVNNLNAGELTFTVSNAVHDCYTATNNCLQLIQSPPTGDYQVETKFDTLPGTNTAAGIFIKSAAGSYVRYEYDGTSAYAYEVSGGTAVGYDIPTSCNGIVSAAPFYMRVTVLGNTRLLSLSANGTAWTYCGSHALNVTVTGVGLDVDNAITPRLTPIKFDYFHLTPATLKAGQVTFQQSSSAGPTANSQTAFAVKDSNNSPLFVADTTDFAVGIGTLPTAGYYLTVGGPSYLKGDVLYKATSNSATAIQIQNNTGKNVFTVDTSGGQIILGNSGASGVTGQIKFNYTGQTGSITLAPANPTSSAISLTLPADTTVGATICTNTSLSACNTAGALTNVAYLNATTQTFTGINSFSRNGTGAADYTLGVTGTTSASATSSLVRIGNAITGGNSAANGGTYLGINESSSGAGSAADFLNLQNGTTVEMQLTSAGNLTVNGTYNTNTFNNAGQLTFGNAGAASILSNAAASYNLTVDTGNTAATLNLGNAAAATAIGTGSAAHTITIGTGVGGTNTESVTIGALTNSSSILALQGGATASAITLQTGNNGTTAGTITIGNPSGSGATAQTISIGSSNTTSGATNTITIGNAATATDSVTIGSTSATGSTTTIQGGTGTAVSIQAASTGTIAIGSTAATTVNIATGAFAHTVAIATDNTTTQGVTIGSTNSASTVNVKAGALSESVSNTGYTLQTSTNTTTAYQIQNAVGTQLFDVDTTTGNLLANPSIEQSISGNWTTKGTGATVAQTSTQQYIGSNSLSVTTTGTANAGALQSYAFSANTTYTLYMEVKAVNGSIATINMGYQNVSGTDVDCLTGQTITNAGWTQLSCSFTTGATITSSNVYIKDTGTNHLFYIDAIQLTKFSILTNPSIEQAISGNWIVYNAAGGTIAQTTAQHYDGADSLSLVNGGTTNRGVEQNITLSTSTTYYLTFEAMSTVNFSTLRVGYSSTTATTGEVDCLTAQSVVTTGWTQYNCSFTTPTTNSGSPYLYFVDASATSLTFYIDAVELTQGPPVAAYASGAPAAGSFIANPAAIYQDGKITLNGVITSPVVFQNQSNSDSALQIQSASGAAILNVNTNTGTVEISATTANTSGLKFTNLTSSSTGGTNFTGILGLDPNGNVGLSQASVSLTSPALAYWDGLNDPTTGSQSYPLATVQALGVNTFTPVFSSGSGVQLTNTTSTAGGQPAGQNETGDVNWNFSQVPFEETQFQFKAGGGTGADSTWFYSYANGIPTTEYGAGGTFTKGYMIFFSEYHGCVGISYGSYTDGNQCGSGGGTSPLTSAHVSNIGDNNFHDVDIQLLDNQIIVRWDGAIVLSYSDSFGRDLSNLNFGFASRTGGSTNNHYIRGLLVTKLGTNTSNYNINSTSPLANGLTWDNNTSQGVPNTAGVTAGFLGINATSPQADLEVDGTGSGVNTAAFEGFDYGTGTVCEMTSSACSSAGTPPTATASTNVWGTGTTFTSAMVGDKITFANGVTDTIASFVSATNITTTSSHVVFSGGYRLNHPGTLVVGGNSITASGTLEVDNTGLIKTTSATALQVDNASSTVFFGVNTSAGAVDIGSAATGEAAGTILTLDSDNNSTFNAGTATSASTEVNGAMFYSSSDHNFLCGTAGSWITCNGLLYSNTAAGSNIASCTTACSALATAPIPANYCKAGRVITLNASGVYTTSATTIQFGIYYGNNAAKASDTLLGGASGTQSQISSSVTATAWTWQLRYTVTCFSTTTMMLQGYEILQEAAAAAGTSLKVYALPISATTTVTTTSANNLYVFPAFGANAAGDNATMEQYVVTGN